MPKRKSLLPPKDPMLTVEQVAAALTVCTKTVRNMIADGRLDHSRLGRTIRIAPADLKALILSTKKIGRAG
jgi:excisionase family DNA binding protein